VVIRQNAAIAIFLDYLRTIIVNAFVNLVVVCSSYRVDERTKNSQSERIEVVFLDV